MVKQGQKGMQGMVKQGQTKWQIRHVRFVQLHLNEVANSIKAKVE